MHAERTMQNRINSLLILTGLAAGLMFAIGLPGGGVIFTLLGTAGVWLLRARAGQLPHLG
ncbi:hypothetical protein AGMMS49960_14050 [Betaproteobacteria bacterium]|nr:hypothetical protein AGMMS49543_16520 [Betaproteobacteria bacterium]GHU02226.1 hypothetical protein AGMMS49960_14050 [Betaproteobacteria bacterium]GHU24089.1 hypothetical protein AGMMS50243_26660 [Betaproteobacteria bacterium]